MAARLKDMAGFRNVLVHGYQQLDRTILVDALQNRLSDLTMFVEKIRVRLPGLD